MRNFSLTFTIAMTQLRMYPGEEFKEIQLPDKLQFRYAISNRGRLVSFTDEIRQGRLLKGSTSSGYRVIRYKLRKDGKTSDKAVMLYKLVAEHFVRKTSEDQVHVLHLDYKRDNDDFRNLRWATHEEKLLHVRNSPHIIKAKKALLAHNLKSDGRKLTVVKVMLIKKMLANPNRKTRIKMIAKQFGVSEMQIHRIKSGENWNQVKI